jgi:hypothetical protein
MAFQFSSTAFHFPRNPRKSIYGEKYTKDHYLSFVFFATCSPTHAPCFVIPATIPNTLDPVSRRTLIVLCLTISLSLVSFGGVSASLRHFLDQFRPHFFDLDSNLVFLALILALLLIDMLLALPYQCITVTTTVTFPIFAFTRDFTLALSLSETESMTLIGRG